MTDKQRSFSELVIRSAKCEILKKLVFSRAKGEGATKVSARLCSHRGQILLAFEYSHPSSTVSHKNLKLDSLEEELSGLLSSFSQANLITSAGEVEWKLSSKGKEALLGLEKLQRRLDGKADFERAVEELDAKKNYILTGSEEFLILLGVSDKNGRVHDKRQGKFRQINRFLEHISDIYSKLPQSGTLTVYDLCCGKSYLSFAAYYYLTNIKAREVNMLSIDLKRDVIEYCERQARECGFTGMHFVAGDIRETPKDINPDMVISLHACDIATDIVLNTAVSLGARVILSTPCCHRYLKDKIESKDLSFITNYPHIANKLAEAATDALRLAKLSAAGYRTAALELTDPDDTPKNTLIRAIKDEHLSKEDLERREGEYEAALAFLMPRGKDDYLKEIM